MNKHVRPAVDRAIMSTYGETRHGQPLSYDRAPAPDLAPWIGRFYATKIDLREGYELQCGLLSETAVLRLQLAGEWTAQTPTGARRFGKSALMFFPHSKRMPVTVSGRVISVAQSLRPGSAFAFTHMQLADRLDDIVMPDEMDPGMTALCHSLDPCGDPEVWILALEHSLRSWIEASGCPEPDPVTARFEIASFTNPQLCVAEFAEECGLSERTLERIVKRDFGMAPKQVLRRARALDMASVLRGVADADEAEELAERFYDQSHLIREFTDLFGMSPRQFSATPQPLMTLSLESRQARRLEMLQRIAPGGLRPWE